MKIRYQLHRRCPTCGSGEVSRSRRHGWLERTVAPLLALRPFRCRTCMRRYWGFWPAKCALQPEHAAATVPRVERELYDCIPAQDLR